MIIADYTWVAIHLVWLLGFLLYSNLLMTSKAFTFNRLALYGILISPFVLLLNIWTIELPTVLGTIPELILYESTLETQSAELIGWSANNIHWILYSFIAVFLLIRLVLELIQIYSMKKNAKYTKADFGAYYEIKGSGAFCFFHWIFIGEDQLNKKLAYNHEKIHADALHSMDILIIRLMAILFWFFPFWRKFEKYYKLNHEYYVDRKLMTQDNLNLKQYVASIVEDGLSEFRFNTLSGMYQLSLIKNRIEMMKSKNKLNLWKNISFGLVLCTGVFLASCQLDSQSVDNEPVNFAALDEAPKVDLPDCNDSPTACFQQFLMEHMSENFNYPKRAKEAGLAGKAFVQFKIAKTSEIVDVEIVKSSGHTELDNEAIRLVESLPNVLEAGRKDGEHVAVLYVVPISFTLKK